MQSRPSSVPHYIAVVGHLYSTAVKACEFSSGLAELLGLSEVANIFVPDMTVTVCGILFTEFEGSSTMLSSTSGHSNS